MGDGHHCKTTQMSHTVVLLIDRILLGRLTQLKCRLYVVTKDCQKREFIVSFFPQPSSWMDAFLYSKNILCRRKGVELLPLHNNRLVQA